MVKQLDFLMQEHDPDSHDPILEIDGEIMLIDEIETLRLYRKMKREMLDRGYKTLKDITVCFEFNGVK